MSIFQKSVINNHLSQLDNEIDKMVYELYGVTDEEIVIVKNSKK